MIERAIVGAREINGPESNTPEWEALAEEVRQTAPPEVERIRELARTNPQAARQRQAALVASMRDRLITSEQGLANLEDADRLMTPSPGRAAAAAAAANSAGGASAGGDDAGTEHVPNLSPDIVVTPGGRPASPSPRSSIARRFRSERS